MSIAADKWVWRPSQQFIENTNVYRFMKRLGFDNREDFLRFSSSNSEAFWDQLVKEVGIEWFAPYQKVLDTSRGVEWAQWFVEGKLNIAWNCLDRHALGSRSDHVACIGESENGAIESLTFAELYTQASRLVHAMEQLGMAKGDRAALYMPMIPAVAVILYACFKLGLVAVPIFSGFGPAAIGTRIEDSGARILFTGRRRGAPWQAPGPEGQGGSGSR